MKQQAFDSPRDWAVVIYSVLGLAVVCFPGGVLDFLEERNNRGWLSAPVQLMGALDRASAAVGLSEIGAELRSAFAAEIEQDAPP
jgi:hypothetical protein